MRIYYGWYIVAITMLVFMLSLGSTIYAFGLFVLPVADDFGLSRANINTGIILLNFGMAIFAPLVGRVVDNFPVRRVMLISACLFGASFIILSISHNILLSASILALPLPIAVLSAGTLTSPALVARWFTIHRGRAMAIAAIGISLGSIVTVPLIGLLLGATGWRWTLACVGLMIAAVLTALVKLVREEPSPHDREPKSVAIEGEEGEVASAASGGGPITWLDLLKNLRFWLVSLGAGLGFGVLQTIVVSLVPFAQERGLTIAAASGLISLFGGMAIVGKLVLAWLSDRVDLLVLLAILFLLAAVTCIALLLGESQIALVLASALLGLTAGATTPAFLSILAAQFGPASFGTANGTASFVLAVLGAACIRFGGEVYDRTGSYDLMFSSFVGVAGLAGTLLLTNFLMDRRRNLFDRA